MHRGHLPGIGVHGHARHAHLYLSPSAAQAGANSVHSSHLTALASMSWGLSHHRAWRAAAFFLRALRDCIVWMCRNLFNHSPLMDVSLVSNILMLLTTMQKVSVNLSMQGQ